jgi:HK97 family phage major capsid protein
VPSEGGFLVPEESAEAITARVLERGVILPRTDQRPVTRDRVMVRTIDETSRADGNRLGGVVSSFANEGSALNASKPKFGAMHLAPKKLTTLIYVTDEELSDAANLARTLESAFAEEATFVIEDQLINGQGTYGPLGLLHSDALITVNPESGQASATVRAENLRKIMGRLWPPCHRRGIWLMGIEAFTQIADASFSNGQPIVQYVGDRRFILGAEMFVSEYPAALGSEGDVILLDPAEIVVADRGQTLLQSVHVEFLAHQSCFRFTWRLDAQLKWKTTLTPRNASVTTSPVVTLGAR